MSGRRTPKGAGEDARRAGGRRAEREAHEWLVRREAGFTADQARAFETWRAADSANAEAFDAASGEAAMLDGLLGGGVAGDVLAQLRERASHRARRRRRVVVAGGAAAALAMVLAVGAVFLRTTGAPGLREAVPLAQAMSGEQPSVSLVPIQRLPDGSIVELNAGAEVSVQFEPGVRRVRLLRGEAHFRVEKDAARPFLVGVGDLEVRAVGTAFTVQLQAAAIEVVVTEGRVALDRQDGAGSGGARAASSATLLDAGRIVRIETGPSAQSIPNVRSLDEAEIEKRLAWRKPRIELADMSLAGAVALFNGHNRLQMSIEGGGIGEQRISGSFRPDNPEAFARVVAVTFDLSVERRGDDRLVLRARRP